MHSCKNFWCVEEGLRFSYQALPPPYAAGVYVSFDITWRGETGWISSSYTSYINRISLCSTIHDDIKKRYSITRGSGIQRPWMSFDSPLLEVFQKVKSQSQKFHLNQIPFPLRPLCYFILVWRFLRCRSTWAPYSTTLLQIPLCVVWNLYPQSTDHAQHRDSCT